MTMMIDHEHHHDLDTLLLLLLQICHLMVCHYIRLIYLH